MFALCHTTLCCLFRLLSISSFYRDTKAGFYVTIRHCFLVRLSHIFRLTSSSSPFYLQAPTSSTATPTCSSKRYKSILRFSETSILRLPLTTCTLFVCILLSTLLHQSLQLSYCFPSMLYVQVFKV